ncbi:MAG: enoyl-CoA hydratase/isomerase [Moorea sp. SIOASIH]|uniref:VatJ n=1 Tax=Moorena producens ASI16Jul14-2 TaxID=2546228 RepID=A0A4P8JAQ0_9CYAN|nr:enoyl-CoA hydratase/isomerase [Moorena sp. SIOASIH]NEO38512.1 enoyl-CoA hydratase/isomerase [Moorena sp. SIOASIH]QCP68987.1 VatJ [Moorena producens ASI16Jul14-2]
MYYKTIKINYQPAVQRIQIYRPEANNSINDQLTQELLSALQAVEAEETVKVVIIEGLPEVFCTGMDFQAIANGEIIDTKISAHAYYNILKQMSQSSKVIVSLVRGKVQAGGVGFVAASDLVIADETTTFVLSELLFGLLPACVLPFLIRRVGFQKAYRLSLTTQPISASEAYNWSLVDEYGSNPDKLISQYIRRLRYLPSSGVKELKDYMNKLWIIQTETQNIAANKSASLLGDPTIQAKIKRFAKEGLYPWQS